MRAAVASQDGDGETIIEQLLEDGWTKVAGGLWVKAPFQLFLLRGGRAYRENLYRFLRALGGK